MVKRIHKAYPARINLDLELYFVTPTFGAFVEYLKDKSFGDVSITDDADTKAVCFRCNRMTPLFVRSIIFPWIIEHFGSNREVGVIRKTKAEKMDFIFTLTPREIKALDLVKRGVERK